MWLELLQELLSFVKMEVSFYELQNIKYHLDILKQKHIFIMIESCHNTGAVSGNSLDFYVWNYGSDTSTTIGTRQVLTIDGNGLGIFKPNPEYALDANGTI